MRRFNRFKLYSNTNVSYKKIPKNLNKFYRPKWNFAKKKLAKTYKVKFKYIDLLVNKVAFRSIQRVRQYYKLKFQKKRFLNSLFDWGFKFNKKKAIQSKKDLISFSFIEPLFKIDILLWYLNIFQSLYQARQFINSGYVLVNKKIISSNYNLKCGDIISLNYESSHWDKYSFNHFINKYLDNMMFFTFIEIDHYTKTIVVIKNLEDLTLDDFKLLIQEHIKL